MLYQSPDRNLFRFSDQQQERIWKGLLNIGPGPAAFYRDACFLMSSAHPLETTTHLVAHLFREVESAFRESLEPLSEGAEICRSNNDKSEGHKKSILATLRFLEVEEDSEVARIWLRLPGRHNLYGLASRAHREDLDRPRPVDSQVREFWIDFQRMLDELLDRFGARYLAILPVVDDLLRISTPIDSDAERLRKKVPNNPVIFQYFFSRANTVAWIEPLSEAGFFINPPSPLEQMDGSIHYPQWPQSEYLARMASLAPDRVLAAILAIPETDNPYVLDNFCDVALALPPILAAQMLPRLKSGLDSPYQFLLPQKLGHLVAHLATGGELDAAMDLACHLLALFPDPRLAEPERADIVARMGPEPRARYDFLEYGQILKGDIQTLVAHAGLPALELLCDLLQTAVEQSAIKGIDPRENDLSGTWRPDVATEIRYDRGARNHLVTAVLEAAEQLIPISGKAVLDTLEERPYQVFARIGLHLRTGYPEVDPEGTERIIRTRGDLIASTLEGYLLLGEVYGLLPAQAQEQYLVVVEQGPDWCQKDGPVSSHEQALPYLAVDADGRKWQYQRLYAIRRWLIGDWKERYEALRLELGEMIDPETLAQEGHGFRVVGAPADVETLGEKTIEELVADLMTWTPTGKWTDPSYRDMGTALRSLVAGDPDRYAGEAQRFKGLRASYIATCFEGWRDALKEDRLFAWYPVLTLSQWVLEQGRESNHDEAASNRSQSKWRSARIAVARLLSDGFTAENGVVPFTLRRVTSELLARLAEDSDPTPAYERQYGGDNMDAATLSINTVRGIALHGVMRYILWVYHNEVEISDRPDAWRGMDNIPEVRDLLERHLDAQIEPSPAVHSIYGQWLRWLVFLDRDWVIENREKIFPDDPALLPLRQAAWDSYLRFCGVHGETVDLILGEYAWAVGKLGQGDGDLGGPGNPIRHLVEHLMVLCWWGKLRLDKPDHLLQAFFDTAPVSIRTHSLSYVGGCLCHTEETPPDSVLGRLRELWDLRVAQLVAAGEETKEELSGFGQWFASGCFEDIWSIEQLEKVLRLAGTVEEDHLVVERLAQLAPEYPSQCLRCLSDVLATEKTWRTETFWAQSRDIIVAAMACGDSATEQHTIELINRCAARGNLRFRDLWDNRQKSN